MALTKKETALIAEKYQIEHPLLLAFLDVESGGEGFFTDWNGKRRIKIQFEPHHFRDNVNKAITSEMVTLWDRKEKGLALSDEQEKRARYWRTAVLNKVENQTEEWKAFNAAFFLDPQAAMLSTSWGASQVMGFNFWKLGFATVNEMVEDFKKGEFNQIIGMMEYCRNTPGMMSAMRKKDFRGIAKRYNGASYEKYNYHNRISDAYKARGGRIA